MLNDARRHLDRLTRPQPTAQTPDEISARLIGLLADEADYLIATGNAWENCSRAEIVSGIGQRMATADGRLAGLKTEAQAILDRTAPADRSTAIVREAKRISAEHHACRLLLDAAESDREAVAHVAHVEHPRLELAAMSIKSLQGLFLTCHGTP